MTISLPRRVLLGLSAIVVACLLWQYAIPQINENAVASFGDAVRSAKTMVSPQMFGTTVWPSLMRILIGFGICVVLGVTLGCILGSTPWLQALVRPVFDFLRATPSPIIIPVAIAVLGLGGRLVIGVIVFGAIWPVLINTTDAIARVEPQYLDVARVARLGRVETMLRVKLPSALPLILPGLRLTMQLALVLMVTGEMLGASSGVGYQLVYSQQTFDIAGTYGGILVLSVIGFLLDVLMVSLEKKYVRIDSRAGSHGL
jgi:ABC-type nitrate/sulfonate/bicarbonate transport system permease component